MSHGYQMVLVLFAMVLFSTLSISMYNGLSNQSVMTYRSMTLNQGLRVADRFLQKIGAENLSGDFDEIYNIYNNNDNYYDTSIVCQGVTYNLNICSNYCDSSGVVPDPYSLSLYQRIDIRIWCKPSETDTLHIGTQTEPFSEVIAKM